MLDLIEARELSEEELTGVTGGGGYRPAVADHRRRHHRRRHHRRGYYGYGYDGYGYDDFDDDDDDERIIILR